MEENSRFDFCPKCGAVSKDGICQSCGYQNTNAVSQAGAQPYVQAAPQYQQTQYQQTQYGAGNGYPQQQGQAQYGADSGYPQPGQVQYGAGNGYPQQGQAQYQQTQYGAGNGYPQQGQAQYQQTQYGAGSGYPQPGQMQYGAGGGYPQQGQAQYGAGGGYPQQGQMQYGAGGYPPQMYQASASVPPAKPKQNKAAVVIYFICLAIVLVGLVGVILAAVSDMTEKKAEKDSREGKTETVQESTQEADEKSESADAESKDPNKPAITYFHRTLDVTEENWNEEGQDASLPYYSGPYNALRDDLSYELSFREEIYSADSAEVLLAVEYPQIASGNVPNEDYINMALHYDYDYFHNLFTEEFKPHMSSDSTFYVEVNSHVTYMDEKILSVVFVENVYLNLGDDPFSMINYFCMNFDLETGTLLEDAELLRLDEAFAVDFRRREAEENGEGALTGYSDQEILDMLKDTSYLVVFYTPMGMEVGLNLGERVVYVTYEDYERFLNTF